MNKSDQILKSLILFLILSIVPLKAQDTISINKIKSLSQHYIKFSKEYPQEKVYLHFDNTAYYLGETIWFKAYAVRADRNSLSPMSKVLYVELVNTEGYVIDTKKLKLENGQCHGEFKLNPSSYGGFYEVRAYTLYMMNFGQANYFSRVFPIYDSPKIPGEYTPTITERPNSQSIPKTRPDYSQKGSLVLNFFPEGGNMVEGITSKVAFKATGKTGEDALISGAIYNDKNEKVVDINSEYQGMGLFNITPNAGRYYAKIFYNNTEHRVDLPIAQPKGFTMTVDNMADEKMGIYIQKNGNTPSQPLGLSVSCRGVLYAFEKVNLDNENAAILNISKRLLPSGVTQITLYNASGDILCERLAFVNHQSQLKITATQNKATYQPFEKVNLNFQLNDAHSNPVETTFSLSVRDGSTSPYSPYNNNILSDLLLSSEIKGYIENPGLYFQYDDNAHRQALDLLLLTQGWTRYSWKQMAGKSPFKIKHGIEKELIIDGNIASVLLKKKMKNVDVSMILITDSLSQQGKCNTDSVGNFNFGLKDFHGDAKLILQSKVKDKRKDTRIMLNRQFAPDPRPYLFPELNTAQYFRATRDTSFISNNPNDSLSPYSPKNNSKLSMSERENLLKEITIKEKRLPMKVSLKYEVSKEMDKMEDTGDWQPTDIYGFLAKTNRYVTITPQPDGTTKATYKGKNIRFLRRDSKTLATEVGDDTSDSGSDASGNGGPAEHGVKGVLPLIDEIESVSIVEDFGTIMRISGGTIIDPTKTALAVITLKKNYQRIPNGVRSTTFEGFAYTKDFFSPQYNKYRLPTENDYRRTLYWNPDVKSNKEGKATVSFYNNGTCKTMNINAETVTENGVIGAINK